jgi:WD40 repeat protein
MRTVSAPPVSPFKGLAAFADSELDALFFFGREGERDVIVANMLASRLTVLYGESGVGKSSLLAAAVVPALREAAAGAPVVLRDTWSGELPHFPSQFERDEEGYLVLDQFEEYFLYHGDELLNDLPELLTSTHVNVLISLREDSLARLDAFKSVIPRVFANQLRLDHLEVEQARRAILGPLGRWKELTGEHVDAEPALVEAVVDDVAVEGRVEAPYLQLVLERVWEAERETRSWLMRRATLERLGGAAAIVRDQFRGALEALPPVEQGVAAAMLEHLVTPTGTKVALDAADLAGYADVDEDALRRVLAQLTRDRIVHSVDGSDRYEIFHDVLAEPISAWRLERRFAAEQTAARRRQRRLVAVIVVALMALVAVSALAVWAFAERGTARQEARQARARALDATALQDQVSDPNRSVRLAYAATQLDQTAATEAVLRQTLITDRLRLVKHVKAPVTAVAVSPRGNMIAVGVRGSRLLLLDARTRRLVRTIPTPTPVAAVGFVAGGRQLVTATSHGIAQLWDPATGRRKALHERTAAGRRPNDSLGLLPVRGELARMITHVQDLSVTSDGTRIAAIVTAGDGAKRAWLFDRTGRLLRVLPPKGIRDITFSPDGSLLATASALGYTILWHSSDGRRPRTLLEAKSGSYAIAFSPDGRYLASGGADSGVRVWNVATDERVYLNFGHTNPVTRVAWSPDGHVVATSSLDGNVLLWRMQGLVGAGSLAGTLAGSKGRIEALAFSPTGANIVTGGEDRTVRVWDALPDKQLALLGRSRGAALDARWAGRTIVGLWPHVAKTYEAGSHELTHVLRGRGQAAFTSLASSRDGALIAAGAADGTVDIWDDAGELVAVAHDPTGVTSVAVSLRGDAVASGDRGGTITLRDREGHERATMRQSGAVLDLEFSPDGTRLVGAGPHGAVIWRVPDGHLLQRLPSRLGDDRAVFSPDGTLVATAGLDGNGRLWFVETGRLYRVLRGHRAAVTDIAFSGDGRLVATSSRDADARVWNVKTGVHHLLQRTAFGPISRIAFDPSGRWVAGAAPISVILWTEVTGRSLFYLRGHSDHLTAVTFAPHSPTMLTASLDGTLRTYTCDVCVGLDELVHLARVRLARTR